MHTPRFAGASLSIVAALSFGWPAQAHEFSLEFAGGCCAIKYGGSCVARPSHPDPQCRAGHVAMDFGPTTASWTDCIGVGCVGPAGECLPDIATGSVVDVPNGLDDDCDGVVDQQSSGAVEDRTVNVDVGDGCCGTVFHDRCDARPQHPDPRCKAGRASRGPGAGSASWTSCLGVGCVYDTNACPPDLATGSIPEVANGRDDDCDGFIDDEQCDGVDNDNDGLIDEDVGSCLVKLLFVPLCFTGTQQEFAALVEQQMQFFRESLSLTGCERHINNFVMNVADVNLPCPATDNDPICTTDANQWYQQALAAAAGAPGANPANYNDVVALTNRDICGRVDGYNTGGGFIWTQTNHVAILTHEVGHYFGLSDEYCSVQAGGPAPCNDTATSINFLGSDLGCDPNVGGCCSACTSYSVCCQGNRNDLGGRCIMSYSNAAEPRAWCARCRDHLTAPANPRSATNPNGLPALTCAFTHIGARPAFEMNYSVDVDGQPTVESSSFSYGRTSLAGELLHGRYATELQDESGNVLFHSAYDLTFGGSDVSDGAGPVAPLGDHQDRGLKIAVPASLGPSSRIKLLITRDGARTAQTTVNGRAPTLELGPDRPLECTSPQGATASLSASTADPDGDTVRVRWAAAGVTFSPATGSTTTATLPMGQTTVQAQATDGLFFVTDTATFDVRDTTPPAFVSVTATPSCLWPPNHRYVVFELGRELQVDVHDACDAASVVRVVRVGERDERGERDDGHREGDTSRDAVVVNGTRVCLRAEREDHGSGRTYVVVLEAVDTHGNRSTWRLPVEVPHDQRAHCPALPPTQFVGDEDPRCLPDAAADGGTSEPGEPHEDGHERGHPGRGCSAVGGEGAAVALVLALAASSLRRRRRSDRP